MKPKCIAYCNAIPVKLCPDLFSGSVFTSSFQIFEICIFWGRIFIQFSFKSLLLLQYLMDSFSRRRWPQMPTLHKTNTSQRSYIGRQASLFLYILSLFLRTKPGNLLLNEVYLVQKYSCQKTLTAMKKVPHFLSCSTLFSFFSFAPSFHSFIL